MKKLFSFLAILGIILASNCSRIPENNDPVIGIWSQTKVENASDLSAKSTVRKEWIFNDAYLGRFHEYNNNSLDVVTDFKWTIEDEVYTITYPDASVNKAAINAQLVETKEKTSLIATDGTVLAEKE